MTETQRERETKFDVPGDWVAPDPLGLLPSGGSVTAEARTIVSTYYDTASRDLLAAGVTLRRRVGGGDDGWQLKIPTRRARVEYRLPPSDGDAVPEELGRLTAGLRGRSSLRPLVRLQVERAALRLLDAAGEPLAEIVTDTVTAGAPAVDTGWTEVEVELQAGGTEKLLRAAGRLLTKHGARPAADPSKLARALGAPAARHHDPSRLGGVLGAYLDAQYVTVLRGDIDIRRDPDTGVDAALIHRTRVATRRFRSVLRVFAPVLDAERAVTLDAELAWYASLLGAVRDRHVLREHLSASLADLPGELVLGPVSARITETLLAEEHDAVVALHTALRSARYVRLLRLLRDWRSELPIVEDVPAKRVGHYLRRAGRKVDRRLRRAQEAADDAALFHRARKAAKRARYTAELARPVLGSQARTARTRAKAVQQHLGDRQDDTLAADFLRRLGAAAGTTPGENGFTYGVLYERERARARRISR